MEFYFFYLLDNANFFKFMLNVEYRQKNILN